METPEDSFAEREPSDSLESKFGLSPVTAEELSSVLTSSLGGSAERGNAACRLNGTTSSTILESRSQRHSTNSGLWPPAGWAMSISPSSPVKRSAYHF